jgi:flagellar motor switch protein FliN/FliY
MDKNSMTTTTATAIEGFIETCRKAWADTLSRVAGAACEVHVSPDKGMPQSMAVCISVQAEGALAGQAAFVIDECNVGLLASKLAGNSGNGVQSVQELVRQTVVLAFNEFQKQFGPTRVQVSPATSLNWQPQTSVTLIMGTGGSESLRTYLLYTSQPTQQSLTAPASVHVDRRNMHLVMGVELEVTLRFGQRKLPLRQLVELNAGSIVELDKRVHEPVELLLRDKIIARGEVVIVEGHYGLRVTEVFAAAQESMA